VIHPKDSTQERILDIAQQLVQTRGYNAFSYADVAAALHITKASLHYHFPSKAHLGLAIVSRYHARFSNLLDKISSADGSAANMLHKYIEIYAAVLADHRMCLCGMLAAEFETLPPLMQSALDHFFDLNERWLESVVKRGQSDGTLKAEGSAREHAEFLVAALEGAMMLARSHENEARFTAAAQRLLAQYVSTDTA
jgi:TetR/AcrR family transcriptional regulator, transcriptional repressor for nem operon